MSVCYAIPAGSVVTVVLSSANHDPDHFTDADGLDITRPHNPHLAFGHGVHFCLGVSLARMEAQVALGTLFRRLPDLALAVPVDQLRRPPAASPFRGLLELPVTFTPQARPAPEPLFPGPTPRSHRPRTTHPLEE